MTPRRSHAWVVLLVASVLVPPLARGGTETGLVRAQQLFQQNRWHDARAHLAASWSGLAREERDVARFVIGRSYVREAELYAWVRRFADEVGTDYLGELARDEANRKLAWLPLFRGFHELSAGRYAAAAAPLREASASRGLPAEWRAVARRRAALAASLQSDKGHAAGLDGDASAEARYWRSVLAGGEEPAAPGEAAAPTGLEALWASCGLLRAGDEPGADALLARLELDRPAVETVAEENKVLRFYDPMLLVALERLMWERAVRALEPLTAQDAGPRGALAAFYVALALHHLGRSDEARTALERARGTELGREQAARQDVLAAALSEDAPPTPELFARLKMHPEAMLLWTELEQRGATRLASVKADLPAHLETLTPAMLHGRDRARAGRWGLLRLYAGADPAAVAAVLSKLRDNANKNRIEHNDPLLLLALAVANYRGAAYAQSLETLFSLSTSFPGLRGVHWNVQGTYAARQSAGGEARISP